MGPDRGIAGAALQAGRGRGELKLQTGWQCVDMRDCQPNGDGDKGWSWLASLRIFF